jgi:hypothetical protein
MRADPSDVAIQQPSRPDVARAGAVPADAWERAGRKFLKVFPRGFRDDSYLAWERDYKCGAHQQWVAQLDPDRLWKLLWRGQFLQIAATALGMNRDEVCCSHLRRWRCAMRSATRRMPESSPKGWTRFSMAPGRWRTSFENCCTSVASLPRTQTRVLTWPLVTVFGFIAQPRAHIFLTPVAMKKAARMLGHDLPYSARPNWTTYSSFLEFASSTRAALSDLRPRDLIDVQFFLWVRGSDEYN